MSLIRRTLMNGKPVTIEFNEAFDRISDICIVGLGTAGAISAIAAARLGSSIIGVDLAPIPGGVATAACVWDYYYGSGGGIGEELNKVADEIADSGIYMNSTVPNSKRSHTTPVKSLALEQKFNEYGIETYYSSFVTDVITEDDKVCGIVIFDGVKSIKIGASIVIDAADGSVCRLCGLKELGGRRSDGKSARFSRTVALKAGELLIGRWTFCDDYAGTTPEEAACLTYKWAAKEPCLANKYNESNRLYAVGCMMGKREVPCIETEVVYTFEDYLSGVKYDNAVFYSFSPLDNANPDIWNEDEAFQDWMLLCGMHAFGVSVGIPPQALIPKGIRGLLVAGKHIGVGHTMTSTVRMRSDLENCGEAAGVIAALAVKNNCGVLEVCSSHFDDLRKLLESTGCYDITRNRGVCDLNIPDGKMWKVCRLPQSIGELHQTLESIHPSLGLFAVRIGLVDGASEALATWLESENKLLRENSAVALGLINDRRALPVLREILSGEAKVYVYESPVKYRFPWLYTTELCNYVKAACLIGRFKEKCDRTLLNSVASYTGSDINKVKAAEYAKVALKKCSMKSRRTICSAVFLQ
jgi:hypothetical protein